MGIVSSLDHHLARLMMEIVRLNPKLISSSERNISVQDVFLADSIEEFKEILIEREIDTATRDSFEDQISWFERKLSIGEPIQKEFDLWNELVEIIERRNLFAHANGIVNSRYIKKIGKTQETAKLKVGDELYASPKYFSSSLDNICEFGVKIAQVTWRKAEPSNAEVADTKLGDFGYSLIERGEYKLARRVLEFATGLRGKRDEARRRMNIVNLANAYKLEGNSEKSETLLKSEDWSIVSDQFAISVAAVRGDVERVISYMKKMSQSENWDGEELEQWAVFYHVRDDERFIDAFELIYSRKYSPAPKNRNRILENFFREAREFNNEAKRKKSKHMTIEIGLRNDEGSPSGEGKLPSKAAKQRKN